MTISAGTLEISVNVNSRQLDSQLSQTHSKLQGFAVKSSNAIKTNHIKAFNAISSGAIMMSRQISAVLKMVSAPLIGVAGKSLHSLFTSQSQAGEEARQKWAGLKSVIDENMTRIGYYVSQSKVFGKNMYEWADSFGKILSKVTQGDIQKLVDYLERIAIALGLIKAASIGIKFAKGATKFDKLFGSEKDLTSEKIVAGDIIGSAVTGRVAGKTAAMSLAERQLLSKQILEKALQGRGFNPAQINEAVKGAGLVGAGAAAGIGSSLLVVSAAISAIVGSVVSFIGATHNALQEGKTSASLVGNLKTGLDDVKNVFVGAIKIITDFILFLPEVLGARLGTKSINNFMDIPNVIGKLWADRWNPIDPTAFMSKEERRQLDRGGITENEPSFKNQAILTREELDKIEADFYNSVLDAAEKKSKGLQEVNELIYEDWAETQTKIFEATQEYNEKKKENDKEFFKDYEEISTKMKKYAKDMGSGDESLGNALKNARDIITQKEKQPLGYSGQTLDIKDLGTFSTQIQAQKLDNQAQAAQKLIDANDDLGKKIEDHKDSTEKLTTAFEKLTSKLQNTEESFSSY